MNSLKVAGLNLKRQGEVFGHLEEAQSRTAALAHQEKLAEVEQTFDYSPGHFPVEVSFQDETPEPTQDTLEAFSLSSGLGMSRGPPRGVGRSGWKTRRYGRPC